MINATAQTVPPVISDERARTIGARRPRRRHQLAIAFCQKARAMTFWSRS